jgi:hypothetical protein
MIESYFILHLTPEKVWAFTLQQSVNDEIQWIRRVLDRGGDTKMCVSCALKGLLEFLSEAHLCTLILGRVSMPPIYQAVLKLVSFMRNWSRFARIAKVHISTSLKQVILDL